MKSPVGIFKLYFLTTVLLFSCFSHATDIRVTSELDNEEVDGLCTLREALAASIDHHVNLEGGCANGAVGRDNIIMKEFKDDNGNILPLVLKRPLEIYNSVIIEGLGIDSTIIQAPGSAPIEGEEVSPNRLFNVNAGTLVLRDMTIENGDTTQLTTNAFGGAILVNGSLNLNNVKVRNNKSVSGGAIAMLSKTGRMFISNSFFNNNESVGTGPDEGGGVIITAGGNDVRSRIEISSSTFFNNNAARGGGALDINGKGFVEIVNSTFYENAGGTEGGGAIDVQGVPRLSLVYMNNLTIIRNVSASAIHAGGIEFGQKLPDISRRRASIYNTIIVGNLNNSGGQDSISECSMRNSDNNIIDVSFSSFWNLYGRDGGCNEWSFTDPDQTAPNPQGDETVIGSQIEQFVDLEGFDIETNPYLLLINDANTPSPIIDKGAEGVSESTFGSVGCRFTDQRGTSRNSGNRCDIGAIEFHRPTAVNDLNQSNLDRKNRTIVVDILANDLVDSSREIDTNTIKILSGDDVELASSDELLRSRLNYYFDEESGIWIEGSPPFDPLVDIESQPEFEERELLFRLVRSTEPGVVNFDLRTDESYSEYVLLITERFDRLFFSSTADNELSTAPIEFRYTFHDSGGERSAPGTVSIQLLNAPPRTEPDEVFLDRAQTVIIDILGNDKDFDSIEIDPDGSRGPLQPSRLNYRSIKLFANGPDNALFAQKDAQGETFGSGIRLETTSVFVEGSELANVLGGEDPALPGEGRVLQVPTGRVIYTPENTFQTFNDIFYYTVEDQEVENPATSRPTPVRVTYVNADFAAGDLREILDKDTSGSLSGLSLPALLLGFCLLFYRWCYLWHYRRHYL